MTEPATVDLDAIAGIAQIGILRTAVFLGLGLNSAHDPNLRDYSLDHLSPIHLAPPQVDDETLQAYKQEYANWIIACGFRELTETFAVFLDAIHSVCLAILVRSQHEYSRGKLQSLSRGFSQRGIRGKLEQLKAQFGITPEAPECLSSISQARNCLAHRRGVVGREDCDGADSMCVRWRRLEAFYEHPEGVAHVIEFPISDPPIILPEGVGLNMRYAEATRSFPVGTRLVFDAKALHEICVFVNLSTNEIRVATAQYAGRQGIPVHVKGGVSGEQHAFEVSHEEVGPDGLMAARFRFTTR